MARTASKKVTTATSRRDEILDVAAQVIAERGIKGATVRDIGQAAGILSGSLYYHFESKEQIVLELLLPSVQAQYEHAVQLRAGAGSPGEALEVLIRDAVASTASNPNQSVILRNEARAFNEIEVLAPIAKVRAKMLGLFVDVVADGQRSGEFRREVDADIVVRAIFDGMLGAARWFNGPKRLKAARVADALVDLYVHSLRA